MFWKVTLKQKGEYVDLEFLFDNRTDAFDFMRDAVLYGVKQTQAIIEYIRVDNTNADEDEEVEKEAE